MMFFVTSAPMSDEAIGERDAYRPEGAHGASLNQHTGPTPQWQPMAIVGNHQFDTTVAARLDHPLDFAELGGKGLLAPDQAQIGTLEQLEQNLAMCLLSVPACRCSPPAAGGERWVRPDRPK
jgi:hypothetical protein